MFKKFKGLKQSVKKAATKKMERNRRGRAHATTSSHSGHAQVHSAHGHAPDPHQAHSAQGHQAHGAQGHQPQAHGQPGMVGHQLGMHQPGISQPGMLTDLAEEKKPTFSKGFEAVCQSTKEVWQSWCHGMSVGGCCRFDQCSAGYAFFAAVAGFCIVGSLVGLCYAHGMVDWIISLFIIPLCATLILISYATFVGLLVFWGLCLLNVAASEAVENHKTPPDCDCGDGCDSFCNKLCDKECPPKAWCVRVWGMELVILLGLLFVVTLFGVPCIVLLMLYCFDSGFQWMGMVVGSVVLMGLVVVLLLVFLPFALCALAWCIPSLKGEENPCVGIFSNKGEFKQCCGFYVAFCLVVLIPVYGLVAPCGGVLAKSKLRLQIEPELQLTEEAEEEDHHWPKKLKVVEEEDDGVFYDDGLSDSEEEEEGGDFRQNE